MTAAEARECEHDLEEHRTPFGRKDDSTNKESSSI